MKKSLLLTTALCATLAASATDYAPTNWQFANMSTGSAESVFIEEGASLFWGLNAPFTKWYTNGANGGIAVSFGHGESEPGMTNNYTLMTEEQKAQFAEFYKSVSIVDGGEENLMCLIGPNATVEGTTYPGAQKSPDVGALTMFWISGDNIPLNSYYRLTFEYRVVAAGDYPSGIQFQIGNGSWNGIDEGGDNPLNKDPYKMSGYRTVDVPVYQAFPDVWYKTCIDIYVRDTKDQANPALPLGIKMNIIGSFPTSMFLFRQPKLEQIDTPNADYVNKGMNTTASDFNDNPSSGVSELAAGNDVIVVAANGNISVIDANAPVEVYNMAGAKVASVAAPATVETISLDMNGVFVVKVGDKVQKVIL